MTGEDGPDLIPIFTQTRAQESPTLREPGDQLKQGAPGVGMLLTAAAVCGYGHMASWGFLSAPTTANKDSPVT